MLTQNEIRLRERVEELEEENRQLRDLLAPPNLATKIRLALRLPPASCKVLARLLGGTKVSSREQLYAVLDAPGFEKDRITGVRIVDVYVVRIRRVLERTGLDCSIDNVRGCGWKVRNRELLLRYVEEKTADAA